MFEVSIQSFAAYFAIQNGIPLHNGYYFIAYTKKLAIGIYLTLSPEKCGITGDTK